MNMQTTPFVDTQTIATAATVAGSFVYNMQGVGRASIQFNATLGGGATDVISLTYSLDGVNYSSFAIAKTVTLTGGGTTSAIFELGAIDYVFLKVNYATPSAGTVTIVSILYGTDGKSAF